MILAVGDSFFDKTSACYSNIKLKTWPEHFDDEVKVIGHSGCDNYKIFQTLMEEFDEDTYDMVCINWTQLHRLTIGNNNFILGGKDVGKNDEAVINCLHERTDWYQVETMIERFEALEKAVSYLPCKVIQSIGPYPFGPKSRYKMLGPQRIQDRYWNLIESSQHVRLADLDCEWTDVFITEDDGHPNNEGHRLIYNWMKDKL